MVLLRSNTNRHVFVDASSIRRPGPSSRGKSRSRKDGGPSQEAAPLQLPAHCRPNRFVAAGPLAAAAVCRDGVVLAAFHASPALEPLLVDVQEEEEDVEEENNDNEDESSGHNEEDDTMLILSAAAAAKRQPAVAAVRDLPRTYRGPFRVAPVDGYGTALLSAGWRSDCHSLAARCRSLASEEAANYGHGGGDLGSGSGSTAAAAAAAAAPPKEDYAAGIAYDASLWLARCALSGGTRTKNCVGLLASCCTSSRGGESGAGGRLYLIDAAGVHRARALAIGHGSDCINRRLLGVDFSNLGRDEAVRKLMDVIVQDDKEENDDEKDEEDDNDDGMNSDSRDDNNEGRGGSTWQLPKGSLVELAFVDARQMRRIQHQKII